MARRQSTAKADPFQDTMQVAFSLLECINTPTSLAVKLCAEAYLPSQPVEFATQIKAISQRPSEYSNWEIDRFRSDYMALNLFSKLPSPDKNPDLKSAALEGFIEGENKLKVVNQKLSNESKVEADLFRIGVDLQRWRKIIKQILGRAPSLRTLAKNGSWSSGASFLLSCFRSDPATKCEKGVSCTLPLARAIHADLTCDDSPLVNWSLPLVLTPGNLVDTVPKNLTTDRTIAKEPEINMFFQKAIGASIRRLLGLVGIDLNDQSNNQWACSRAHALGLATLDLKNASNSISINFVKLLLPTDWWELIELTRSPFGTFSSRSDAKKGIAEWFEYSMISSMGNGFTFELESLLFFSLCLACGVPDYLVYVYGDDIIIPQTFTSKVVDVLEYCGFSLNTEKSFLEGNFFESCGVYFFSGYDVTPIKIKELLYGPKDCIVLANKIRWFAHLSNLFNGCKREFLPAWQACIRRLPDDIRTSAHGPVGYGLGVWKNRSEVKLRSQTSKRNKPFYYAQQLYELRMKKNHRKQYHEGVFINSLYRISCKNDFLDDLALDGNKVPVATETWQLGKLFHTGESWYDLGHWE